MDAKIIFLMLLLIITPIVPADSYETTFYAEGTLTLAQQVDYISNTIQLNVVNGYATGEAKAVVSAEGYQSITYSYTFSGDMENDKIVGIGSYNKYTTNIDGSTESYPEYHIKFKAQIIDNQIVGLLAPYNGDKLMTQEAAQFEMEKKDREISLDTNDTQVLSFLDDLNALITYLEGFQMAHEDYFYMHHRVDELRIKALRLDSKYRLWALQQVFSQYEYCFNTGVPYASPIYDGCIYGAGYTIREIEKCAMRVENDETASIIYTLAGSLWDRLRHYAAFAPEHVRFEKVENCNRARNALNNAISLNSNNMDAIELVSNLDQRAGCDGMPLFGYNWEQAKAEAEQRVQQAIQEIDISQDFTPTENEVEGVVTELSRVVSEIEGSEKGNYDEIIEQLAESIVTINRLSDGTDYLNKIGNGIQDTEALEQKIDEISEILAEEDEEIRDIMIDLQENIEESRRSTILENAGKDISDIESRWSNVSSTVTINAIETAALHLQNMDENNELNIDTYDEAKEFLDYLEQGVDFLEALTRSYGDAIFGPQINTGDKITDTQLNKMYDLLEKQLFDDSFYKTKNRYNLFKNILNKTASAIRQHRRIDEAIAQNAITEEDGKILKGATWFGKVVSVVTSFLPFGGSEADTITEQTFDCAVHFATMQAVLAKEKEVCSKDPGSDECFYMNKVRFYAPECIKYGWDSDICKYYKSLVGH